MTQPPSPLRTHGGKLAASLWSLDPAVRHLNHGSFGGVPLATQHAQEALRRTMDGNPDSWFSALPKRVADARAQVAGFLGVDPFRTALVPNASAGATVVYSSLGGFAGMEIVTTDHTYGAVRMGAERFARRYGGTVVVVPVPLDADADAATDLVVDRFTDRTALVVVDQVTSATARELPAAAVATAARARGIPILVDGAHAPGVYRRPLDDLRPDFWVGNLHKFACSARGTAALVVHGTRAQELRPLIDSWGAPLPFPESFDNQGTLDQTSYLSAHVSFESIDAELGWDEVVAYSTTLIDYGEDVIAQAFTAATGVPARLDVGMPVGPMRLIALPGNLGNSPERATELRTRLSQEAKVETAIPYWNGRGYLRVSAHAYNTAADYDDFAERVVPLLVGWSRERADV